MSCHESDNGKLFICLSPIIGFTNEEQWIEDERKLFNREWVTVNAKRVARKAAKPNPPQTT